MDIIAKIAEQRIQEAMERSEFDNLPNKGRPLDLDNDMWLPEDIRVAYRVLRNAGYVPPEAELRKEITSLRELIDTIDEDKERLKRIHQFNFKLLQLNTMRKKPFCSDYLSQYEAKLIERFIG